MKTIVLSAGKGKRMRPYSHHTPKQLLTVGGCSVLEHSLRQLPEEIDEIILVVGHMADKFVNRFGDNFLGRKINYVFQEKCDGTFRALELCRPLLEDGERFLVFCGDDIHGREGIENCLKHKRSILVSESKTPERYGVVVTEKNNLITQIIEKPQNPPSNLVSTGAMIIDTDIFDYKPARNKNGEYYLSEALAEMLKDKKVRAVRSSFWVSVGCPEDLKKARQNPILQEFI